MTTDTTYNGWPNRSTWLVNLHLANDHATYLEVLELVSTTAPRALLAARARWSEQSTPGLDNDARRDFAATGAIAALADELDAYVQSMVVVDDATDDPRSLLANDLVLTALADVDWREIVEGWAADAYESDPELYNVECAGCDAVVDSRTCTVDPDADPFCDECASE